MTDIFQCQIIKNANVPTIGRVCSVEGCFKPFRCKGFCKEHYVRFNEYGRLDKIVTGEKTKHLLYSMWNRRKQNKTIVEEWFDFNKFLSDVGEKPEGCFLSVIRKNELCGPNNFEWRKIKTKRLEGETDKDLKRRRVYLNRKENPNLSRASNYKYNFGITLEQYNEMLKAQNGVCFICEQPETATYKSTGKVKNLAIDHCHKTNKIRKLLCSKCNLFLGKIEEDLNLVNKAVEYLKGFK